MVDAIINFFVGAINKLIEFILYIFEYLLVFIGWVLDSLFTLLIDIAIYFYDQLKLLIEYIANSTDFSMPYSIQQYFDQIPLEIQQTIAAIGIVQGFSIIASAYLLRLSLRAIPFIGSIFK